MFAFESMGEQKERKIAPPDAQVLQLVKAQLEKLSEETEHQRAPPLPIECAGGRRVTFTLEGEQEKRGAPEQQNSNLHAEKLRDEPSLATAPPTAPAKDLLKQQFMKVEVLLNKKHAPPRVAIDIYLALV